MWNWFINIQPQKNSASTSRLSIETTSYPKTTKAKRKIVNESRQPSASKSMQADTTSEGNKVSEDVLLGESSWERSQNIVATNAGLSSEGKNLI
jgi:hypothetical protein